MLLSRTTGLGRLALKKAKAPGKPRGFGSVPSKTSRTGKTDADKTGTSKTGTDRTGSFSDDSIPTIDASRLRMPSLPDFSGSRILSDLSDSSRRSGLSQPFDIELLSSFTSRHLGVDSLLVPKFEGPLAVLNDYGVGPTSTLKFLERLEDKEWFGKFAGVVQQHALDVTKGYGRSFRLDVPFHQYKILSRMHDAGTFAEDWLHTSSSKDMIKELVGWFPAGGKLDGGVAVLGRSGIVVPSHFVDYDRGGVRVSGCLMTTSEYHALDGYLAWMVFHFKASRQFCYAAIGSGEHPVQAVDRVNPILGGAMMNAMAMRLALGLRHKFKLAGKTPEEIRDFITKADPELARQCEMLGMLDLLAVAIALYRQKVGGITVAVPKPDDSE